MTDHAKYTHASPQRIFRFSQLRRFSAAERLADPQPGERILEFGGGDGFLVANLAGRNPDTHFTILEPFREPALARQHFAKNVAWVKDISECRGLVFDKITCFEVLEHLVPEAFDAFLAICRTHLRPGGTCVISMPLEVGLPALYKNVLRVAFGRPHEDTTLSNVVKSILFMTDNIERQVGGGEILGHIGFNAFKALARIQKDTDLILQRTVASPFEGLPWFVNNQLFFVFVRPEPSI